MLSVSCLTSSLNVKKMASGIYNVATWVWHKVLRRPVKLNVAYDNHAKHVKLTVVFLHGISATSDTWRSTFKQIESDSELKNVRLIALDLLGFGKSLKADWLKYNEEEYLDALNRSLKKVRHSGPIVLIGHSMGSLIAADYVVDYNNPADIEELILVSPPLLMADELAKLPDQVYTKSYGSLHKFASEVPAAEVIAKLVQKFSSFRSDYIKGVAFERSMDNIILNRKNYQTFIKIRLPTLIIHGHFDPLVMGSNLRRAAKHNPHYLKYISVIGHHDISVGKRAKIILKLKKILKEGQKNEAI